MRWAQQKPAEIRCFFLLTGEKIQQLQGAGPEEAPVACPACTSAHGASETTPTLFDYTSSCCARVRGRPQSRRLTAFRRGRPSDPLRFGARACPEPRTSSRPLLFCAEHNLQGPPASTESVSWNSAFAKASTCPRAPLSFCSMGRLMLRVDLGGSFPCTECRPPAWKASGRHPHRTC